MIETLKTFLITFKENKRGLLFVLIASLFAAIINEYTYGEKYKVTYEVAPYFEMASDLGAEFQSICEAINSEDKVYLENKFNSSLPIDFIEEGLTSKVSKTVDHSFKHFNLKLEFLLTKKYDSLALVKWDSAMTKFCNEYLSDSLRSYRGIMVCKEKLESISESYKPTNKNKRAHNYYKNIYSNEKLILNDSVVCNIVRAHVIAEYQSALKLNHYNFFSQSIKKLPRIMTGIEIFVVILILPFFLLLILLRTIKYE